jgi:hypothetical protein
MRASPAKVLPDGASISEACIETRDGKPCIAVDIVRNPFEKLRLVRPRGQLANRADKPALVPYISIRDGRLPRLTVDAHFPASARTVEYGMDLGVNRPRIAIVLDGDLAYETPDIDTPQGPLLFMPDGMQSRHLRSIGPRTPVMARLYYTTHGEYREISLPLSSEESGRFASEFHGMLSAYESLYLVLKPNVDTTTLKHNESVYGETDRAGSLQWND